MLASGLRLSYKYLVNDDYTQSGFQAPMMCQADVNLA